MAIGSKAAGAVHARYHRLLKTAAASTYEAALKVDLDNTPSQQAVGPVAPHGDLYALLERYYC